MHQIKIHQAKTQLSKLVEIAASGEVIFIAKAGRPIAKLVPLDKPRAERKPGGLKGKIWIAEDFDAPLSEEELAEWYEGKLFP